jgi:two-component system OmpR family sensor kinase
MTSPLTGPDVQPDVRAEPISPGYFGPPVILAEPAEDIPTHPARGAFENAVGPPVPVEPYGQDGWMDPLEPRGRWWNRISLRVRLVAASLALVLFALMVIGTCSAVALQQYLIGQADDQLGSLSEKVGVLLAHNVSVSLFETEVVPGQAGTGGSWFSSSDGTPAPVLDLPPVPNDQDVQAHLNRPFTVSSRNGQYRYRMLITQFHNPLTNQPGYLMVAQNLSNVDSAISRLVLIELLVGFGVLIVMGLASVWVVRVSLRPLAAIERTAGAIAGGDLAQRVPELDRRTELGQLSAALNTMLSQIESAFQARALSEHRAVRSEERMRQFVADASHELRTPLTTIRGFAELYRQGAASDPSDVLRRIENEAARMGLLVEDLLMLARLDQERPLQLAPVALPILLADAAAAAHAVAPERTIAVDVAEPADRLVVAGDEGRLRQIIGNLVTNALTHTPAGTPIALRLRTEEPDQAVIEVSDQGPGLAPEQAEHVFERFYRVDKARTRRASAAAPRSAGALASPHSGAGLGLAIVAALVAAHNGTVEVQTAPGLGATFRIRLPLAPTAG